MQSSALNADRPSSKQRWKDFQAQEERIKELKQTYPELLTFSEIWKKARKQAQQVEWDARDIEGRSSFSGAVGSFIGRAGGSFTWRDPLNIATLGLGGFGPTLGARLATEVESGPPLKPGINFSVFRKIDSLPDWRIITLHGILFAGITAGHSVEWQKDRPPHGVPLSRVLRHSGSPLALYPKKSKKR